MLAACQQEFVDIKVKYITMPGWQTPTSHIRKFTDLPVSAQLYVRKLEELVDVPGLYTGVNKTPVTANLSLITFVPALKQMRVFLVYFIFS